MDEQIAELHRRVLYPSGLVRAEEGGKVVTGSGTVIYSRPDEAEPEQHVTYLLTNYHVVEGAVKVKDEYSPHIGKEIKRESRSTVMVEFYEYANWSELVGRRSIAADIVAYHKHRDIALLRLRSPRQAEHVAELHSKDTLKDIHIFDELILCGCALGHKPIATFGHLTSRGDEDDEIENYIYWLSSAPGVFGVSGGSVFRKEGLHFIGIPSRVSVVFIGFGGAPITHMSWFIPLPEIYKWLDDECYQFLYDSAFTQKQCDELRKQKVADMRDLHSRTDAQVVLSDDRQPYM